MQHNPKAEKVLDVGLNLLKSQGDYGVTMRQVASKAGMSLGHVQYYFKNKNELLKAMADRYFNACLQDLKAIPALRPNEQSASDLNALLNSFLQHGLEVSEMCRIFREYWAISTRNVEIDEHIKQYYREMTVILSDMLRGIAQSEQGLSKAVSIIIPFVEGYSITALAMPEHIEGVTHDLTRFVLSTLNQ